MVDLETVNRRLAELERRIAALRRIAANGRESFLSSSSVQAEAERHTQVAIQTVIDIAVHVLAEDFPDTPASYGDAFSQLAGHDVIPTQLSERLRRAAGLRNLLVHAYLDIDPLRLFDQIAEVDDLEDFARYIARFMTASGQDAE